ncbi:hypothetical protein BD779DRAFT_1673618 [Infundibulicybe gibba]|nr:hypothetical protein BD779DRAFT_1673618 [Infundibulicybe gibba]
MDSPTSIPSTLPSSQPSPSLTAASAPHPTHIPDTPSVMAANKNICHDEDDLLANELYAPRPLSLDLSPTSSSGESLFDSVSSQAEPTRTRAEAFFAARSRVVRIYRLPAPASAILAAVFLPPYVLGPVPTPATLWALRDDPTPNGLWAVFASHEEACTALTLTGPAFAVATALEQDLEPFGKLRRIVLGPTIVNNMAAFAPNHISQRTHMLRMPTSAPESAQSRHILPSTAKYPISASNSLTFPPSITGSEDVKVKMEYTMSSNPPNPRTTFRTGDWICGQSNCVAHNFGRNTTCIGCGFPRPSSLPSASLPLSLPLSTTSALPSGKTSSTCSTQGPQYILHPQTHGPTRAMASPRFASAAAGYGYPPSPAPGAGPFFPHSTHALNTPLQHSVNSTPSPPTLNPVPDLANMPPSTQAKVGPPLLTPSGRAFARGGKVRNISQDPMAPCIMYWPENEPLPEQGQIRPSGLVGVPQPPILNTGNRGPISHQPGDWICQKCNYLNWRRRKVCQTCLPYAEGNGDSISAAVQAERIALLTSVLAHSQSLGQQGLPHPHSAAQSLGSKSADDSRGTTPLLVRSHSLTPPQVRRPPVQRSTSHFDLAALYTPDLRITSNAQGAGSPIYQTSGHKNAGERYDQFGQRGAGVFGMGMVHAPTPLLPACLRDVVQMTGDEDHEKGTAFTADMSKMKQANMFSHPRADVGGCSIWRLDGEETRSLALGAPRSRGSSQERVKVDKVPGVGVIGSMRVGITS